MIDSSCARASRWIAVFFLAAGCGGGEPAAGGNEAEAEVAAEPIAPAVDPAVAATVRGRIAFEGTPPAAQAIDMSEEPACAGSYGPEGPKTQEVVVNDGGLANVFVYVKEGLSQKFSTPAEAVTLEQKGCRYRPHVLGIQTGQTLAITNDDDVLHNINVKPSQNRGFNISQPRAGMRSTKKFSVPEVMIPVQCDVHGWMQGYIGVVSHPYFAVSTADGTFEIPNLPPGDYTIEAWHEHYGTQTQSVTVGPSETAEITFNYSAEMAENAVVPLGDPVVVSRDAAGGLSIERRSEASGASR